MVDIITSYDAAIFAIIMGKPDEPIIVPEHHLPKQYYLLLKKVEFYCNHHHYGKAMMIFDEVHEDADLKIAEAITGFLFKTKFGRSFHHILEMPLFVSSAVTPAVQFADIFAGIVRHYYENELDQKEPETEFQEWLVENGQKLHQCSALFLHHDMPHNMLILTLNVLPFLLLFLSHATLPLECM